MTAPANTPTSPRMSVNLYRAQGWKKLIKPYALKVMSAFWLKWYKFRYGKRVHFGRNFITNGNLIVKGPGHVTFGDDVNTWCHAEKNVLITYSPEARISIGDGCRLSGAGIQAYVRVKVGPRCMVSSTIMFDSDFHPLDPRKRHDPDEPVVCAPITVGENVWIGGQSAVLKGVTIGDNSVVAFRAVVTKDVPANVVVAGNPARIVKQFDEE